MTLSEIFSLLSPQSLPPFSIHHPLSILLPTLLLIPLSYVLTNEYIRLRTRIPHLAGPPGLPLIGNLHQIRHNAAEQYRKWAKVYGGVYQIMLGNVPVVVVNTASDAKAIFGGHSQALASRPEFYTFHKILSDTAGTTIGTSPYSESLKRRRKGAAAALNKPSVQTYISHLDVETKDFIAELKKYGRDGDVPIDPMQMCQRLSLSLALTLNWGIRMSSQSSHLFDEITLVEEQVSRFRSTTGNLQDYIPLLRWNPWGGGSQKAKEMRGRRDKYLKELNEGLDERMKKGVHRPCIQANIIQDEEAKLNKAELTSISLTMLSGGLDTITTLLQWSIALLAQRPDIQEKAYAAIRENYEEDEPLADAGDDQKCAYVVALVRECLRYFTVLRLNLPRATIRDFVHEGVTIPKGSVVFLNAWACNMDPELWNEPEIFDPQRWLDHPDKPVFTYGLGYRMCTGTLLANRELYLAFLRMVSSFRIEKVDDMDVDPVKGSLDPTSLVSMPHRYKARFVPRNKEMLETALDGWRGEGIEGIEREKRG